MTRRPAAPRTAVDRAARCSTGSPSISSIPSAIRCCRRCNRARCALRCPSSPPARGEPLEAILEDFRAKIVPGITHWNHPSFFAYFATSSSVPGILAEMLTATLDVKAMLWRTSPAATELEQLVTDWLRQMLGLGDGWFGMTTDTASMSSMLALAAAREARPELAIRERGMAGRDGSAAAPRVRVGARAFVDRQGGARARESGWRTSCKSRRTTSFA